jgi:hypothetical protein
VADLLLERFLLALHGVEERRVVLVFQERADLGQRELQRAQPRDQARGFDLRRVVVAVAGLRVDERGGQ